VANDLKRGGSKRTYIKKSDSDPDEKSIFRCTACGKAYTKQAGNFNVSPSPYYAGNDGYLHICKRCLDKYFNQYRDEMFDGDQDKAMEFLCSTINTCFDKTAWANAKKHPSQSKSKVSVYFSKLNLSQTKGASYADTVKIREENKVENAKTIQSAKDNPEIETPIEIIQLFGLGFSAQDYETLQYEYEDWVKKYGVPEDKRQEELYKSICYLKVHLQHSIQNGEAGVGALAKAYKEHIDAATTELEDRKQKKEDAVRLDPLGMWIKDIEQYTPAEFFKDKTLYKDSDGLGSYASRFIFRPLKNLLTGSKELDKEFSLSKED